MQNLRSAVAGLRGELESFGTGAAARLQEARAQIEPMAQGVQSPIAGMRPEAESTVKGLSGRIEALDAELAELEP